MVRQLKSVNLRLAGFLEHPALRVILHDISEPLPSNFPASDIIIHSASQASPKYYGTDPVGTLMANTAGTMYLLNHARLHNSARFCSSAAQRFLDRQTIQALLFPKATMDT